MDPSLASTAIHHIFFLWFLITPPAHLTVLSLSPQSEKKNPLKKRTFMQKPHVKTKAERGNHANTLFDEHSTEI